MGKLQKNSVIMCEITDMNSFGAGVSKYNGEVVFVRCAVTGDIVAAKIIKSVSSYSVAAINDFIKRSQYRIENKCPSFPVCGGCSFRNIEYSHELELKRKFVRAELDKNGLREIDVLPVISNGVTNGYRNKAQFPVSLNQNDKLIYGFFKNKTHDVCPADNCVIQDCEFSPITAFIANYSSENGIPPYDEKKHRGVIRHIYLRKGKTTGEIYLCIVVFDTFPSAEKLATEIKRNFPSVAAFDINVNRKDTNVILGDKWIHIFGDGRIRDRLLGSEFEISGASFYQINHDMCETLYETAFRLAGISKDDTVADLYCGIGTISVCAARSAKKVIGIEIVPEAVENAGKNALLNKISNCSFYCADAASAFKDILNGDDFPDVVIVDPPRRGLDKELISDIASNGIKRVLYISCAPDTLARDIALFYEKGYGTVSVQPVDMFPRTGHVESVVLLSKLK